MLYAEVLVLICEKREENTELMVSGDEKVIPLQSDRYPCAVCGKGVGVKSILCTQCHEMCQKKKVILGSAQNGAGYNCA